MTHEYTLKGGAPYAIVLSFLAGCLELMAGLLNLGTIQLFFFYRWQSLSYCTVFLLLSHSGWIMDFISGPVISGFCSAAAATVIFAQFKTLLGLKFPGSSFSKVFPGIFINWRNISLWDSVLGFTFIVLLLLLKVFFPHTQSNDSRLKTKYSRT